MVSDRMIARCFASREVRGRCSQQVMPGTAVEIG